MDIVCMCVCVYGPPRCVSDFLALIYNTGFYKTTSPFTGYSQVEKVELVECIRSLRLLHSLNLQTTHTQVFYWCCWWPATWQQNNGIIVIASSWKRKGPSWSSSIEPLFFYSHVCYCLVYSHLKTTVHQCVCVCVCVYWSLPLGACSFQFNEILVPKSVVTLKIELVCGCVTQPTLVTCRTF